MMPPLLFSAANALLEQKVRIIFQLDPFWREHLVKLNGLRLKLVLTDIGFKRVIQFGPNNIYFAAPFGEADAILSTQISHLFKLRDVNATAEAIRDGYFHVQGSETAFAQITTVLRQFDLDWEAKLAEVLPDFVAFQVHAVTDLASKNLMQSLRGVKDSYQFWCNNEFHQTPHTAST